MTDNKKKVNDTEGKQKERRRNKADFGPNFLAPDGGYAWVVCVAVGLSNFCIFSIIQQFGLIFKEKFQTIGLTSSQITTIVNTTLATSSCSGFLNGPLFRRFSYRQVAIFGGFLSFIGLFCTIFCNSFVPFLISNSIVFALGNGISMSASTFTLYTYFKQKRRRASSLAWTITGLAQIVCPFIVTALLEIYGPNGTTLIFSGFILHMQVFALLYQPVKWHTKSPPPLLAIGPENIVVDEKCYNCLNNAQNQKSKFASQYLDNKTTRLLTNSTPNLSYCTCEKTPKSLEEPQTVSDSKKLTRLEKTVKFFDLDLFKDFKFSLIVMGLTLINFADSNFAVLTPFILADFKFDNFGIARILVAQGISDLIFRFLTPFLTANIKLSNRFFYSVSAFLMIVGRTAVALSFNNTLILVAYVFIGMFKGIRTVFFPLIIPSYVDLKRLPAATGLSYLCNGIFSLICGPFLGKLRDFAGYRVTIHLINSLGLLALGIWLIEELLNSRRRKKAITEGGK
ncbi:hypothetical protein ACFFRR_008716 [Megaselia abdita]